MKNFLYKIYDEDCPICQFMEGVEDEIRNEYGVDFPKLTVSHAAQYSEIFSYLNQYVAEDGELDLPCYLNIAANGRPIAHLCGEQQAKALLELCKHTL